MGKCSIKLATFKFKVVQRKALIEQWAERPQHGQQTCCQPQIFAASAQRPLISE
jgi:hypothetical protein